MEMATHMAGEREARLEQFIGVSALIRHALLEVQMTEG
jgi:hypothetical protein